MNRNALIEGNYAAAWKRLDDARVAQANALIWASRRYEAGRPGQNARKLAQMWDRRRRFALEEVFRIRGQIRGLRMVVRSLETKETAHAAE